jgi:hypothetical protein
MIGNAPTLSLCREDQIMRIASLILSVGVVIGGAAPPSAAEFPQFETVTIDANIGKVCYAVTAADINGDRKLDIVAVSENRVQWYENPSWTKHVILEDQTEKDNVCIAPFDIDNDGQIDFALGAGWTRVGTIQWITRQEDPAARWKVHPIFTEVSTHRMSFADVLGTRKPQLVVSPLLKTAYNGARLLAFEIPGNPRSDRWRETVLDASLNRMHNHTHVDWNGDGLADTVAASEQGVYLITRQWDGSFQKTLVATGAVSERPEFRGAGEIKVGRGPGRQLFLATIEPMHGTHACVYLPNADGSLPWQRVVLDDTLKQGHAVWTADLTGDQIDEVVIGHREAGTGPIAGPGVYVFQMADNAGRRWTKHVIDNGGCAVEDALAADFNGDGRIDLVAGGRATHNVQLYLNRGAK